MTLTSDERRALQEAAEKLVCNDMTRLAPKMKTKLETGLNILGVQGIDAIVYETGRSDELEKIYYQLGTTRAPSALYSWHGYWLAGDIISKSRGWDVWPTLSNGMFKGGDKEWYGAVVGAMKAQGLEWGGDWMHFFDAPHFQFPNLKDSPSDLARVLYSTGGYEAVWREVHAN